MRRRTWILIFLVIVALILRLRDFHILPIDGHPMRQTDTESVIYNFAFSNGNILYPQNSLIRPITNKNAYFFLEFPAYEYVISRFYVLFGAHVELARMVNIGLFLISVFCLYGIVKDLFSEDSAFYATIGFLFAPASIFFLGHALHPDVFCIATILISIYLLLLYFRKKETYWLFFVSLLFFSLSVSTRPFILMALPAMLYIVWKKKGAGWHYIFLTLSGPLIYVLWKIWQLHFPEASSSWENWVLGGRNQLINGHILIGNLIMKNIVGEVVGKISFVLALIGFIYVLLKKTKNVLFLFLWIAAIPIYWILVPEGNIIHQYYADVYLIPLIILSSFGFLAINAISKKIPVLFYILNGLLIIVLIYNGYRTSTYYFQDQVPASQLHIAKDIEAVIPMNSRLVYLAINNSIPFSLVHRKGFMLGLQPVDVNSNYKDILSMKQYGAEYIVAGKDNTDISAHDLKEIEKSTQLVYQSEWTTILKFR